MRELIDDPFYEQMKAYKNCIIDFCLIEDDVPYQGYRSHKDAILFAMCKIIERDIEYQLKAEIDFYKDKPEDIDEEPFPWSMDMGKAKAKCLNAVLPDWYAFWEAPHKTGYGKDDFMKMNSILFPKGVEMLDVYEWTTDWSNYFDAGHEWWGTACFSVYDRNMDRYVVMMASTTD